MAPCPLHGQGNRHDHKQPPVISCKSFQQSVPTTASPKEGGYRLYMTTDKSAVPTLKGSSISATAVAESCNALSMASQTGCTQLDAVAPDRPAELPESLLYFQAVAVCSDGVTEGCAAEIDPPCP